MKRIKIGLSHEARVGLAVLVGVIIVVLAILNIGEQQGLLAQRYRLRMLISRVEGLQAGAPVRLAGVRVGVVRSVAFSTDPTQSKIEIVLEITKDVKPRIRKDSIAYIGTLGLLGDKYVGISMGSLDQPILEDDEYLQSSDPLDVEELLSEGAEAFGRLKKSLETVDEIVTKINTGQGTLGKLVNDPNMYFDMSALLQVSTMILEKIERGEGTMARLFEDPKLYDNINALVASTSAVIDSLRHGEGSAARLVRDPKFMTDATDLVRRLTRIAEKLENGQGSLGQMVNDGRLYERLNTLTVSLDSLVKDVKMNPKKYLKVEIF